MAASIAYGLVSAKNENILALSNLNLDFSLLKFAPPPEYDGVGLSLSPRRRKEAEDGQVHTVARKLALLLCEDLPQIPHLLKAYGKRASEISENPSSNPRGTPLDGVFQDHIGLDATSLWASATSGQDTVALHLLACMLSRIWKKKAVSVWVELVENKKAALKDRLGRNLVNTSDITASAIQLSREQLAEWDASARSWLESADVAFLIRQKQLMLILDNMNIGIKTNTNVLQGVTDAWKASLRFMEDIVTGKHLSVQSGEILLAMSAWHLYPNLEVFAPKRACVIQNDPLIAHGGVVTIGLETPHTDDQYGISWSLPLSHVQYYGKVVHATESVNSSNSRISMKQLIMVAFGCAVGDWAQTAKDIKTCARIFIILAMSIEKHKAAEFRWLSLLSSASQEYLDSSEQVRLEYERLFAFGRRRSGRFLSGSKKTFPPWFNLHKVSSCVDIFKGSEAKVRWLRNRYECIKDRRETDRSILKFAIIACREASTDQPSVIPTKQDFDHHPNSHPEHPDSVITGTDKQIVHEFASLAPIYLDNNGEWSHRRWLPALARDLRRINSYRGSGFLPVATSAANRAAHIRSQYGEASSMLYQGTVTFEDSAERKMKWSTSHVHFLPSKLSPGFQLADCPDSASARVDGQVEAPALPLWYHFSKLIESAIRFESPRFLQLVYRGFEIQRRPPTEAVTTNSSAMIAPWQVHDVLQDALNETASQLERITSGEQKEPYRATWKCFEDNRLKIDCLNGWYEARQSQHSDVSQGYECHFSSGTDLFRLYLPCSDTISKFALDVPKSSGHLGTSFLFPDLKLVELVEILEDTSIDLKAFTTLLARCGLPEGDEFFASLNAQYDACTLYEYVPGAQVELCITNKTLATYRWTKSYRVGPDRASAFACVATFETGYMDSEPKSLRDVMGISVGNSLYIAQELLQDPYHYDPFGFPSKSAIHRAIGNIGKSGLAFLLSPQNPSIRDPGYDRWRFVQHAMFDGTTENNFSETSLHLCFTGYEMPINTGKHGLRDKEAYFLQAAVQIYEVGTWIADIDVIKAMEEGLERYQLPSDCEHDTKQRKNFRAIGNITMIDCWDELLDSPKGLSIARAKGNWLARLAITAVAFQTNRRIAIADGEVCWSCVQILDQTRKDAIVLC